MTVSTVGKEMMFVSMQIYEFLSKSQLLANSYLELQDVCLYANIRIFKQITTYGEGLNYVRVMFVSMQIYEFLSKSQQAVCRCRENSDVCLYANIRIFKQITTKTTNTTDGHLMFVSMQIYEFLSKSQPAPGGSAGATGCLSLCKYTNF